MNQCNCGKPIEPMRLELLPSTRVCSACAKLVKDKGVIGFMEYCGKTAPVLVMVEASDGEAIRLANNAYGRARGRDLRAPTPKMTKGA